jgi:hypothetical protein
MKRMLEEDDVEGTKRWMQSQWEFTLAVESLWTNPRRIPSESLLGVLFAGGVDRVRAFLTALKAGHVSLVRRLLRIGLPPVGDVGESVPVLAIQHRMPLDVVAGILKLARPGQDAVFLSLRNLDLCRLICASFSDDELVDMRDSLGEGLLCQAAEPTVVQYLLSRSLSPFPLRGPSAFIVSASRGQCDLLAAMLPHVEDIDASDGLSFSNLRTALMLAVECKQHEAARWLLQHKADPNFQLATATTAFSMAVESGDLDMIRLLRTDHFDRPRILQQIAEQDSVEIASLVLADRVEEEDLSVAVQHKAQKIARWMLDLVPGFEEAAGARAAALEVALQRGPESMLHLLIARGVRVRRAILIRCSWALRTLLDQILHACRVPRLAAVFPEVALARVIADFLKDSDDTVDVLAL